ncbi:MAG: hypothetical protein V4542_03225 [Pseudomonadota bacterium]
MPSLNTPQRVLLACTGIAILLFQLYRFSTDGIEGYGWILSFLVSTLLLLPIFGLFSRASKTTSVPLTPAPIASPDRLQRAKMRVEMLALRASERAKVLHRRLPILLDLPPLQSPEFQGINALMTESWLQYCIAYTGSLSLMTEWKREPKFPKQHEYEIVRKLLIGEMVKAEAATAARNGLQDNYNFDRSMQFATSDFGDCEIAMKKFVDRLAANTPEPDAPMIDFLMQKIGAPEQSRPSLSQGLRRFTRETMQQFSATET